MFKLIEIRNVSYSIPYGKTVLQSIDIDLMPGDLLGVLGRNGVGKSTLMDLLLGVRPVSSGSIQVLGEDPLNVDRKNLNSICFLSQDIVMKGSLSVRKVLDLYASYYDNYSKKEEESLLNFFQIRSDDKLGSLSTGQQKKVATIAALSSIPKILLIDEITAVLDPETRGQFFQALNRHRAEYGMGVILATNIAEDLISRANKVLFIEDGRGTVCNPGEILNLFNIGKVA